jgi:hypothetical protein
MAFIGADYQRAPRQLRRKGQRTGQESHHGSAARPPIGHDGAARGCATGAVAGRPHGHLMPAKKVLATSGRALGA